MPTGERSQTGLLLADPDGDAEPLLVDCGSGALHGLGPFAGRHRRPGSEDRKSVV